jgi:hypothetical protein
VIVHATPEQLARDRVGEAHAVERNVGIGYTVQANYASCRRWKRLFGTQVLKLRDPYRDECIDERPSRAGVTASSKGVVRHDYTIDPSFESG